MEELANQLTNYILTKNVIKEEDYEIYRYGFQVGMELSLCISVCIIAAGYMRMLPECTLLMAVLFLQRAYVDGLHMKKFWSCFLLSVGVILCGLAIVKLVLLPDVAVCISALLCLLAVERLSDLYVINDADTDAMMYYFRQKKRVFILVTFLLIGLFDVHYSRGLLIILYAEVVMLVSTFAGFCKKHIYHKKKE
ncbi:MAG: accessory gene regulator B family protein [Lachnospiraceae bacterium]|nr:accessory gene regulator B family protein [Lachnospiraceae bacterium]